MTPVKQPAGDYDLRGPDFETYLVGPVTDKIIDADRLVRQRVSNGFPNWALYRCVYAGDTHLLPMLRDWCVSYAIAAAESGLIRRGLPVEEMGCLAGWDAYYRLLHHRWVIAGQDIADVAGVDPKTYRKLRNYVYAANLLSLQDYFVEMQIAVRQVWKEDRWIGSPEARARLSSGRGFHDIDVYGDGNFIARPSAMSDNLR
jgi:hypothetical protein